MKYQLYHPDYVPIKTLHDMEEILRRLGSGEIDATWKARAENDDQWVPLGALPGMPVLPDAGTAVQEEGMKSQGAGAVRLGAWMWLMYVALLAACVATANMDALHAYRDTLFPLLPVLVVVSLVMIAISSLVAGIQKGRPLLALLALVLTPVGFLIVCLAKPRRP